MSTPHIEYAGGHTLAKVNESRGPAIAKAPAWWRQMSRDTQRRAGGQPDRSRARPPAAADARRVIGWLAGTVCPAVSEAVYSARDGKRLPEQFTDVCMDAMRRQTLQQERPIPITWGHNGPTICTTRNLDAVFFIKAVGGFFTGLEFQARLRPGDELHRRVLAEAAGGLGVSIGYYSRRQSTVERDGVGEVRVIHDAVLDHVAVLPKASAMRACFPAARCYGGTGQWIACPVELHERARLDAYRVWQRQVGVRP